MTWSIVSVPVLSVQSTSIAPRFWMALSRLTMTFFLPIATAPLDRQTVTIIGSISGVRPTATATAKKKACPQLPLVRPLMTKTSGTITSMKRSMSQVKREMPRSKAVWRRLLRERLGHAAQVGVLAGGDDDRRRAEPLSTLVPRNAMLVSSIGAVVAAFFSTSNFSTGKLSPVSEPWMTNRSLAWTMRTSPGIMSPAASWTTSPGTRCATAISCGAAAEHGRRDRDHGLELGGGAVGLGLLDELQADAQDDHQHHHDPGPRIAGRKRDRRQHRQQDHQRVEHRVPEQLPDSRPLVLGQHVGAVLGQTRAASSGGQSLGAGVQPRVDARRVHRRRFHHQGRHAGCGVWLAEQARASRRTE